MNFDLDRLYADDPSYSPGICWTRHYAVWRCPKKYAGYPYKVISLGLPGSPDDEHKTERARLCREHTRDLLRWWSGQDQSHEEYGTWGYLIARYSTDSYSPFRDVKGNTRESYVRLLGRWKKAIGHMPIGDLDFRGIKTIEQAMKDKGRSTDDIRRMMTMLRTVAKYGAVALKDKDAKEVSFTLSGMRFQAPAKRSVAPTREDVYAIIAASDDAGDFPFSLGLMMQFELMLRAVDVRGQWLKDDGLGGIVRNGYRWQDGLTWDMFEPDLRGFTKVISKTARSLPEPYYFDLTGLPEIRRRLALLKPAEAVGPVIVTGRHGLPYGRRTWANVFAKYRAAAGVSSDITAMDMRAGGITEAKSMGVDLLALRDAAQHSQVSTTSGYARGRSETAAKVIQIRQGKKT